MVVRPDEINELKAKPKKMKGGSPAKAKSLLLDGKRD